MEFPEIDRKLIAVETADFLEAARKGRPPEVDGLVVSGDARGGTLGFPTANVLVEPALLIPAYGIYAGCANGYHSAVSIGTNPHYGGQERRIEAFLIDFVGDLYGRRLVVELWQRLRDEAAFGSEAEAAGEPLVVLEGNPAFYGPLGFEPAAGYGIELPLPSWAPPEAAQVMRLRAYDAGVRGRVVYPAAFEEVAER